MFKTYAMQLCANYKHYRCLSETLSKLKFVAHTADIHKLCKEKERINNLLHDEYYQRLKVGNALLLSAVTSKGKIKQARQADHSI